MNRSTFIESFQRNAKARALLAQAIEDGFDDRILQAARVAAEESADLVDLVGEALEMDDPACDMALVFSEQHLNGELITLEELAILERSSREPITVIRVSRDMVDALKAVLS